jgi:hypothetical protein
VYGLITDAHGTLGIRIMLIDHKGIGAALQALAKAYYVVGLKERQRMVLYLFILCESRYRMF